MLNQSSHFYLTQEGFVTKVNVKGYARSKKLKIQESGDWWIPQHLRKDKMNKTITDSEEKSEGGFIFKWLEIKRKNDEPWPRVVSQSNSQLMSSKNKNRRNQSQVTPSVGSKSDIDRSGTIGSHEFSQLQLNQLQTEARKEL